MSLRVRNRGPVIAREREPCDDSGFAVLYSAYLFLAVVLVVLFAELFLSVLYVITGNSAFETLVKKDDHPYPDNPGEYVKVAIFGESAAAGWGAERNFSHIIDYELKKNCPNLKFYVRNYAECSATFHGEQAEILKSVIDKYDIFLVYAGNNEHLPYILSDDSTVLQEEGRIRGMLVPFLEKYSRVYAFTTKISRRYVGPLFTRAAFLKAVRDKNNVSPKPRLFETATRVSWDERIKITARFQGDLDEIGNLIQSKHKYLIISSVPINENYKPLFSVVSSNLDDRARDLFYSHYYQGIEQFGQGDYPGAQFFFSGAAHR